MTIIELNSKINDCEKRINTIKNLLLEKREILKIEVVNYLKDDYKRFVENEIKDNPQNTQNLGLTKLKDLKTELNELINNTKDNTFLYFSENNVCDFESYEINNIENISSIKYNEMLAVKKEIERTIKDLLGYVGLILIKYNYAEINNNKSIVKEWNMKSNSGIPSYGYFYDKKPKNYDNAILEYCSLFGKMIDNMGELIKLAKQKQEQEALDLWNQA